MITLAFAVLIGIVALILLSAIIFTLNYILDAISVRFGEGPAIVSIIVLIAIGLAIFAYPLAASITQ